MVFRLSKTWKEIPSYSAICYWFFNRKASSKGGTSSLNHFWFYPLFPINKTTCCLKCFKLGFPWSQKLLCCSLDPQEVLSLFPIFVFLFYLLVIVQEIIIINSRLVFPWSQQSNKDFPCSLKIIWQYSLFSKNIINHMRNKCSCSTFPKPPGTSSLVKHQGTLRVQTSVITLWIVIYGSQLIVIYVICILHKDFCIF